MKHLLIGTLVLLGCGSVFASEKFYATAGLGFVVPTKNTGVLDNSSYAVFGPTASPSGVSIFNLPNINWQNKFKPGFNASAAIGYSLTKDWRFDIEFLYQLLKRKVVGTYNFIEYDAISLLTTDSLNNINLTSSSGYVNIYSLLTNGYYNFHVHSNWFKPFLGGGFGIAWINANSTTAEGRFVTNLGTLATTLQYSPKLSGTALALQLKAGTSYTIKKDMDILIQYRLFFTSNFIANRSSIITNPNLGSSARTFSVSQQTIHGVFTNSLEVVLKIY